MHLAVGAGPGGAGGNNGGGNNGGGAGDGGRGGGGGGGGRGGGAHAEGEQAGTTPGAGEGAYRRRQQQPAVHNVHLVRGRPFYGYHQGERLYIKIVM